MIFITGDCHGNFRRFHKGIFYEQREMTKEDYVIICGDFGGVWSLGKEDAAEKRLLDYLECKSYTTLFVDGNHENFDRLYSFAVEEWHGGKVHKIRPSVIHLMRGQIYDVDEIKIFTFGGAKSHDIRGGILETDAADYEAKKRKLDEWGISYRINHVNWWEQEMPSEEEMKEGLNNLALNGNQVDFIVSHCCASSTGEALKQGDYVEDPLAVYFEEIRKNVKYKKWFFGHYHGNKNVTADEILLYEQIIRIN